MIPLHCLLIGIDHYEANDYCTSLGGAVADAEALAVFLRKRGVPSDRIRSLESRSPKAAVAKEPQGPRPTYEVMVQELRELTERAHPGEQVLIHYSGHGGRTRTLIPASKGAGGVDEGLVPPDIGRPEARYLRDVELAYLVHAMVEKGLLVTLILDACHSGGLLRNGPRLIPRGRRQVDLTERPLDSLVASREELETTWRRLSGRSYSMPSQATARRGRKSAWLPGARGFVLLAACRSVESAYELPLDGRFRGLLTHSLLGILTEKGAELSWQQVFDRLVSRIHRHVPYQTPVIEGETSRSVLGGGLKSLADGINVAEVDAGGGRVRLDAGQAMGLREGARLRLFPSGSMPDRADRAVVEIEECGAAESWAFLHQEGGPPAQVQPGDRAVLIDPGESFRRRVAWLPAGDRAESASPLAMRLEGRAQRFLEPADGSTLADFQVALNRDGEYELWHSDGTAVADAPLLRADRDGSASRVVDMLAQLASFYNVRDLENRDQSSPLKDGITLRLGLLPEGFKLGQQIEAMPFEAGSIPEVEVGRWICLDITNNSSQDLQIYILDLQPGWGIQQVFPDSGLETLEGGQTLHRPLKVYVPPDLKGRREILKVFATADAADFRWLSQPQLGHARTVSRSTLGTPNSPLERLFAEIAQDGPKTRTVNGQYASRHWTSAQVEFEILVEG